MRASIKREIDDAESYADASQLARPEEALLHVYGS
jgi:hypothetical protein